MNSRLGESVFDPHKAKIRLHEVEAVYSTCIYKLLKNQTILYSIFVEMNCKAHILI